MIAFLIVLIAILVICCGIMLYLYFSVRKEADDNKTLASLWHNRYLGMTESRNMYMDEDGKAKSKVCELEDVLYEKNKQIKMLRSMISDHTISIRTFGTRTNYFSGSIDIPAELRSAENKFDPFDAAIIDKDIRLKLVKMLGEEALKHTGFRMEYDIYGHKYSMIYICPMCVENKYVDEGESVYLVMDSEMPMLDMIQNLFKQKDKECE
jgi:hypothetical protein